MKRLPASRYLCFVGLTSAGLSADLFSKRIVFERLGYPEGISDWSVEWFGGWLTFRFVTTFNPGALWGMGQGLTWLFAALSILAVIGISYWLFVLKGAHSLWLTTALGFIMAGTLGNLYDRLGLYGYFQNGEPVYAVRDFLLFTFGNYHWPVFNFADVFLVTGVVMLVLQSFTAVPFDEPPTPETAERGEHDQSPQETTARRNGAETAENSPQKNPPQPSHNRQD